MLIWERLEGEAKMMDLTSETLKMYWAGHSGGAQVPLWANIYHLFKHIFSGLESVHKGKQWSHILLRCEGLKLAYELKKFCFVKFTLEMFLQRQPWRQVHKPT